MQSTLLHQVFAGLHVAIIMDGNGRWATHRGLPRYAGHRTGAKAVRRIVEAAPGLGVGTLTLFAFSADNWRRPALEVDTLMQLFHHYLLTETKRCLAQGVRISVIGRRDRLSESLREAVESAETATRSGATLHLRLAVDYSGRDAILQAARRLGEHADISRDEFTRLLAGDDVPDVDLLIRTSGEQRLSDFLLWESAYAELVFTPRLWPDFAASDLEAALKDFQSRDRRYGRVLTTANP